MKRLTDYRASAQRILDLQRADGSVPWVDAGVFDPWNHTESLMALAVMGDIDAARLGFRHLAETQNPDGSWWCDYGNAAPLEDGEKMADADRPRVRDTNYAAYPAVGLLHYLEATNDLSFVKALWPMVDKAIGFVLEQQSSEGDIRWAAKGDAAEIDDALVAGNASIAFSLQAATRLAERLGRDRPGWAPARLQIIGALREKPYRFDRRWDSKAHYSMDWYYPVLGGALTGAAADAHLDDRWSEFVIEGVGVKCTSREPWVTVAEACELAMTLLKCGRADEAAAVHDWQHQHRDEDGCYWMGWQYEEEVFWPADKPSWTAAAVILAADALYGWTEASALFTGVQAAPMRLKRASERTMPRSS
ncbi:MAG: prenyltransferase [Pseudomonadota bacterium]